MTSKTIMIGLVALAFVAGSITTGSMAYAASNAQGQPFKQLQEQIDIIVESIPSAADIAEEVLDEIADELSSINTDIEDLQEALNEHVLESLSRDTAEEADRIAVDEFLQTQIDNIELIPGPQGDPGADGVAQLTAAHFYISQAAVAVPPLGAASVSASCDVGDKATGGGYRTSVAQSTVFNNQPNGQDKWFVSILNESVFEFNLIAYVHCVDLT